MQKIDMSGDKPRRIWSLNLDSAKFYFSLAGAVIVVLLFVIGGASAAGDWMMRNTNRAIYDTLSKEIKPPDGVIFEAVEHQIEYGRKDIEQNIQSIEKQMVRQDVMLSEMYQTVTGRQPPPRVE